MSTISSACLEIRGAPRARDKIDAFSRAAHEDDLGWVRGVHEPGESLARAARRSAARLASVCTRDGLALSVE